jgi:hypothetical protein
VHFRIEFWVLDHGDEEEARSQRMPGVHQLVPPCDGQDVVDAGGNVVVADLVPSELNKSFNNSIIWPFITIKFIII